MRTAEEERKDVLALLAKASQPDDTDDVRYLLGQLAELVEGGAHEGLAAKEPTP